MTKQRATTIAVRVSAMSIPTGLLLPQSWIRIRLATIVGSAKGRSMIALMIDLPGKLSRTRSQATIVPKTALIATTISEQTRISSSEALRRRVRDLVPEVAEAFAERFVEQRRERQQHDDAQPEDDVLLGRGPRRPRAGGTAVPGAVRLVLFAAWASIDQPEVVG